MTKLKVYVWKCDGQQCEQSSTPVGEPTSTPNGWSEKKGKQLCPDCTLSDVAEVGSGEKTNNTEIHGKSPNDRSSDIFSG